MWHEDLKNLKKALQTQIDTIRLSMMIDEAACVAKKAGIECPELLQFRERVADIVCVLQETNR